MKERWYWCGGLCVLAIWLAAVLTMLPRTEAELRDLARRKLAENQEFSAVRVAFSGQVATLRGKTADAETRRCAENLILGLKAEHGLPAGFSVVTAVRNRLEIDPYLHESAAPAKIGNPGFVGWVSTAETITLIGRVPDEFAKDAVRELALGTFPEGGISIDALEIDPAVEFSLAGLELVKAPGIRVRALGKTRTYPGGDPATDIRADFPALAETIIPALKLLPPAGH